MKRCDPEKNNLEKTMNMTQHVTLVVEYLFTFSWLTIVYSGFSCNYALGGFKTVIVQFVKLS